MPLAPQSKVHAFDRVVKERTGRSLELYVAGARDKGDSYFTIAVNLQNLTGRSISYQAIRNWARDWGIE